MFDSETEVYWEPVELLDNDGEDPGYRVLDQLELTEGFVGGAQEVTRR